MTQTAYPKARAQLWNGSAWIDAPGDAANGIDVDVTRSVLPTGAATQTTLASVLSALQGTLTVDTELSAAGPLATQATLAAMAAQLPAALVGGRFDVRLGADGVGLATDSVLQVVRDRLGDTASPTAGSANARLEQLRALLAGTLTVDTELSAAGPLATQATLAAIAAQLPAALTGSGNLKTAIVEATAAVPVTDNAGSLTVDAPVGTPAFVRLSDGSAALSVTSGRLDQNAFLANGNQLQATSTQTDGVAGAVIGAVGLHPYNGTNFDKLRNNTEATSLASAARAATPTISNITNYNARGVRLFLNITATPNNAETLTVSIEWVDPVSGAVKTLTAYPTLPTGTTLGASPAAGTREFVFELYPGSVETSAVSNHEVQGGSLPRTLHPKITHSSTGSWTYSLGYALVL